MAIKHTFNSAQPASADATKVDGPRWNADHAVDDATLALAKLANISTARVLGRVTASAGVIEELTASQVRALLGVLAAASRGQYGDGTDGNATDPAAPSRQMFYDVLTLNAAFSMNANGHTIYARKIVVPSGTATIRCNGGNGGNGVNDTAGGGAGGAVAPGGFYSASALGGGGGSAGGASGTAPRGFVVGNVAAIAGPAAGNPGGNGNNGGIGQGGSGGAGGAAAAGTGGASGAGGAVTLATQNNGDIHDYRWAIDGVPSARTTTQWTPGSGGGGGGAGNTNAGGGGGGAGGGYCCVVAGEIEGNLVVEARGGNGGNGSNGTTGNNCGGGGGGGGSGGIAILVYGTATVAPTVQAPGGTGGTGGTEVGTGFGGGNGGSGGAGLALTFQVG